MTPAQEFLYRLKGYQIQYRGDTVGQSPTLEPWRTQYHGTTLDAARRIMRDGFDPTVKIRTHNFPTPVVFSADSPEIAALYGPIIVKAKVSPDAVVVEHSMNDLFIEGKKLEESLTARIPQWYIAGIDMVRVPDQQSGVGNIVLNSDILEPIEIIEGFSPMESITPNPYLDTFRELDEKGVKSLLQRGECLTKYGFAIPNDEAIEALVQLSPLVEIGAGGGYWANMIQEWGGEVYPYDIRASAGAKNPIPEEQKWTDVKYGDESSVLNHPGANLLLIWPTWGAPMAYDALRLFTGNYVAYVGESYKGCTADDDFFELLEKDFEPVQEIDIPQWHGMNDYLAIYRRKGISTVGQPSYEEFKQRLVPTRETYITSLFTKRECDPPEDPDWPTPATFEEAEALLDRVPHRSQVICGLIAAELVLPIWESQWEPGSPDIDLRPKEAIEVTWRWLEGEASLEEVNEAENAARAAAWAAGAAVRLAAWDAAWAAAAAVRLAAAGAVWAANWAAGAADEAGWMPYVDFLELWWKECRCRLAIDKPEEQELTTKGIEDYEGLKRYLKSPERETHIPSLFTKRECDPPEDPDWPTPTNRNEAEALLRVLPPRSQVICGLIAAELVLPIWESQREPGSPDIDLRPKEAIETTWRWLNGEATLEEVREAEEAAWLAAAEAAVLAAEAAARAAAAAAWSARDIAAVSAAWAAARAATGAAAWAAVAAEEAGWMSEEEFYNLWWKECRCRLAIDKPEGQELTTGQPPTDSHFQEIYTFLANLSIDEALGCAASPIYDAWHAYARYEEDPLDSAGALFVTFVNYFNIGDVSNEELLSAVDLLVVELENMPAEELELSGETFSALLSYAEALLNRDLETIAFSVNLALAAIYPGEDPESWNLREYHLAAWMAWCAQRTVGQAGTSEYEIELSRTAKKSLKKVPVNDQKRIRSVINGLALNPTPEGSYKIIQPNPGWAVKVGGNYRVLYMLDRQTRKINVFYAGTREGVRGWGGH